MSNSASTGNDENLLIIEDCPELARAYAVNCMSVYKNYRWPAYQHDVKHTAASPASNGYLWTSDAWQKAALDNDLAADLEFWGVDARR
jgi:phosphatidylserine/phosphatidylglycerophosphate/cardiolipin synthase-like enzyme